MTNHVPTLETCQKLKEMGFPQESYFQWAREWNKPESHSDRYLLTDWLFITMHDYRSLGTKIERVAAPILTEILEQLPYAIELPLPVDCHTPRPSRLFFRKDDNISYAAGYLFENYDYGDYAIPQVYIQIIKRSENPAEAIALLWLKLRGQS